MFRKLFSKKIEYSFDEVYKDANSGDPVAQCKLALMYEKGMGIKQSDVQAGIWYLKAARSGNLDAIFKIGVFYISGKGVPKVTDTGVKWLTKARDNGHPKAQDLIDEFTNSNIDNCNKNSIEISKTHNKDNALDKIGDLNCAEHVTINNTDECFGETIETHKVEEILDKIEDFKNLEILETRISELVQWHDVPVRLLNGINHAISHGLISFDTVLDFLMNEENAIKELMRVKNIGKKSINDLRTILSKHNAYQAYQAYQKEISQKFDIEENDERLSKTIIDLVNENHVSNRLRNRINEFYRNNLLSFLTVKDYKENPSAANHEMMSLPNFGRGTLDELNDLVNNFITGEEKKNCNIPESISSEALIDYISNFVKERNFEIFLMRRGLCGVDKHTLGEVAERYGLTRERVRQIDKKIVEKCRIKANRIYFEKYLLQRKQEISDIIFSGSPAINLKAAKSKHKKLISVDALAIEVVHEKIEGWLTYNYKKKGDLWAINDVCLNNYPHLSSQFFELTGECKKTIKRKTEILTWPISIGQIFEEFPYIDENEIIDYLTNDLGAEINNGIIVKLKKLSPKNRLIHVLRKVGHGLHTSQIRAYHKDMFGLDVSEHAIGAVLGRLEEALIVGRGVYDIYENLTLTSDDLKEVRDRTFKYLESREGFVSAKVIYKNVFSEDSYRFSTEFSDYMLLGILQDDERFSVKHGLMVGLAGDSLGNGYIPLMDQITQVVEEYGPVSVPEISEKIKENREVFDTTIVVMLNSSPDVVATKERGKFNLTEKVLGTEEDIFYLDIALEIALLESAKSCHVLEDSLQAVGIQCHKRTIKSWVSKSTKYDISGDMVRLIKPSDEVTLYNSIYETMKKRELSFQELYESLTVALEGKNEQRFIQYDCRVHMSNYSSKIETIENMLEEFDF
ncbi:hypothetical protein C2E25_16545 [Geothermobacter hydrogeniphilus]|uniref:RNA polymerase sigma-70 region 4 domain-containing protein n=1 Tax=Geothermobacter hydrogeniphilus TaxID=1969733 RepID=A0A2K2H5Q4_9BACT|nr:tetratricopeptide repeat protein [Geothermobacter hydrogeniphilus]PNU18656.1 hypothetical protein C2E25_16545 [Geothermobacter hydrogeniphilus]